jgi:hypothetical protein
MAETLQIICPLCFVQVQIPRPTAVPASVNCPNCTRKLPDWILKKPDSLTGAVKSSAKRSAAGAPVDVAEPRPRRTTSRTELPAVGSPTPQDLARRGGMKPERNLAKALFGNESLDGPEAAKPGGNGPAPAAGNAAPAPAEAPPEPGPPLPAPGPEPVSLGSSVKVVAAWPRLPDYVKRTILLLVESAQSERPKE